MRFWKKTIHILLLKSKLDAIDGSHKVFWVDGVQVWGRDTWYATRERFLHFESKMNPWTWVGVDEPRSRVEDGKPVLCDYMERDRSVAQT